MRSSRGSKDETRERHAFGVNGPALLGPVQPRANRCNTCPQSNQVQAEGIGREASQDSRGGGELGLGGRDVA